MSHCARLLGPLPWVTLLRTDGLVHAQSCLHTDHRRSPPQGRAKAASARLATNPQVPSPLTRPGHPGSLPWRLGDLVCVCVCGVAAGHPVTWQSLDILEALGALFLPFPPRETWLVGPHCSQAKHRWNEVKLRWVLSSDLLDRHELGGCWAPRVVEAGGTLACGNAQYWLPRPSPPLQGLHVDACISPTQPPGVKSPGQLEVTL